MNTPTIVAIVVALIIVAAVAVMAIRTVTNTRSLKDRYGDEYDRALTEHGGRAAAETELKRRVRAHDDLTLTELGADRVAHYREAWTALQAQFIDDPTASVRAADQLVAELVTERGYPDADFDQRVTHLSVEHARVLGAYRDAHTVAERSNAGWASTEDLRQALVSYREVIADVLGDATLDPASITVSDATAPVATGASLDRTATDRAAADNAAVDGPALEDSALEDADVDVADVDAAGVDYAPVDEAPVDAVLVDNDAVDGDVTGADVVDTDPAVDGPTVKQAVRKPAARKPASRSRKPVADADVTSADAPAIPTVDGAEPTAADISANEGYVTASNRSTPE